jgi:hypothetical protein
MMDQIFDWCVEILVYWAGIFGMTYKEINVWAFVIILAHRNNYFGCCCLYPTTQDPSIIGRRTKPP